jgi:hypothetical protein
VFCLKMKYTDGRTDGRREGYRKEKRTPFAYDFLFAYITTEENRKCNSIEMIVGTFYGEKFQSE